MKPQRENIRDFFTSTTLFDCWMTKALMRLVTTEELHKVDPHLNATFIANIPKEGNPMALINIEPSPYGIMCTKLFPRL